MKYYDLDKEEQAQQLQQVEFGEFVSAKDAGALKKQAILAAKNTLNKTTNINIRLSLKDVNKLKSKAAEEGIPYQTLAASILHKSASKP